MKIEIPKEKYNNLTSKERLALYDLKNDKNIVIKGADKGSTVVVWDRDDYIKEAEKQLGDSDVYEEVPDNPEPLISTIHRTKEKIRKRGDLKKETIKYFEVKDPKFARFYLLPKIHKWLNVSGRPVTSNCGYYTENTSVFLDFYLQPLGQAVKSYIKDTNHFLNKLRFLLKWSDNIILYTIDVVCLYTNIPHEEGLSVLRKRLDNQMEKNICYLYVKPTDSHQYLLSSSCYPFYSKKVIPYSLNRICFKNEIFDKRCNDLEKYLLERGYSEKMVRKEILQARAIPRAALLEKSITRRKIAK